LNSSPDNPDYKCISDLEQFGNPDGWKLICKASSQSQKWMKSTKAMDIGVGCLVQVTTQNDGNIAEAVTFVPSICVMESKYGGYRLVGHKQKEAIEV